jgi:hypothetical protein
MPSTYIKTNIPNQHCALRELPQEYSVSKIQ